VIAVAVVPVAAGIAVLVAAPVAGMVATARRPEQATVVVEGDEVVVRALGPMALWALRREVRLPVAAVTEVVVADRDDCPSGVRSPGAHLPGVLTAGTFRRSGEQAVWFVGRARRVVLVRAPGHQPAAVVAEVADPDAVAARVGDALDRGRDQG
jgi:hypothetical protein